MPELPEVETIVCDLRKKVLNRTFISVWTDSENIIKKPGFQRFKKEIKSEKIKNIKRRGKNILIELSHNKTLLIHQKLTGHLLYGTWNKKQGKWEPLGRGFLKDKVNTYIRLLFTLDNGRMLALSDLRKFAKVELWGTKELEQSEILKNLGPEPLEESFSFAKFREILPKRGKIKQVLMDQAVIAGIGNIYSDEILWEVKIHPFTDVSKLTKTRLKDIYVAIPKILKKAVKLRGESFSDYRDIEGRRGFFDKVRKVYRRTGEPCLRCGAKIRRAKIGGRSAHYCPDCQPIRPIRGSKD